MFDTILNVDRNNLISAKSERVKEYCKINNIEFDDIEEPIIVKRDNKKDLVVISLEKYQKDVF